MDSDDSCQDEYYYFNDGDNYVDRSWNGSFAQGTYCGLRPSFLYSQDYNLPKETHVTPEEADRNAKELIEEEQREKEKAVKKRLKKKRQKDRIRQQKLQEVENEKTVDEIQVTTSATVINNNNNDDDDYAAVDPDAAPPACSESSSEDNLDLGSTFVRQVQKKIESKPRRERKERSKERSRDRALNGSQERQAMCAKEPAPSLPPIQSQGSLVSQYNIKASMDLANIGNNLAGVGRYADSLVYYAEAIKLNPMEYRFLGNRSYSFERVGWFKEALQDAEKALELQPHFIKGLFRKGRALKGLKRYSEAIAAFQQVLLCDVNHLEAAAEIALCKQELMTSTRLIIQNPLLPQPSHPNSVGGCNNVVVPRNVAYTRTDGMKSAPKPINNLPLAKQPTPTSISKLYPVWVGNVTNRITEEILRSQFEQFGPIHSIRILYVRTCAFINYTSKEAAESAFRALQGLVIEGTTFVLQLRNPEHCSLKVGGM